MNIANKITIARIFLVPLIMFFLLVNLELPPIRIETFEITYNQIIAALIFIIAASTDGIDGYIARKRKIVTNLGKLLDPLADKLLVSAVLISLVEMGKLDAWIAVVIISREFAVTGLRQIALLKARSWRLASGASGKQPCKLQRLSRCSLTIFRFILSAFPSMSSPAGSWQ